MSLTGEGRGRAMLESRERRRGKRSTERCVNRYELSLAVFGDANECSTGAVTIALSVVDVNHARTGDRDAVLLKTYVPQLSPSTFCGSTLR